MKLYFLSTNGNLYNKIIEPRVPDNYATDISMEDNQTKRIAVCETIRGCLSSIPIIFNKGDTIYVYYIDYNGDIYKPTNKEVYDVEFTGEIWILEPVKLIYEGKIMITDRKEIETVYENPENNEIGIITNFSYKYKFIDEEFLRR